MRSILLVLAGAASLALASEANTVEARGPREPAGVARWDCNPPEFLSAFGDTLNLQINQLEKSSQTFSVPGKPSNKPFSTVWVACQDLPAISILNESPKGFKISAEQVAELATFLRDGTGCTQNEPGLDGSHPENMTKGQLYMTDGWSLVIQAPDSCPK
ncbi:hypothetical protein VTN96DRAFT_2241 [Rasamsonia emersonii]|uniref:Ecp2 effector protein domain-containing protein n=1 Tax=Rasamsonia emersonii (strain ATCC 16479 / CBS 393.64 / IMI 116815) TaxID=1408163 RepID=A0A0F4Z3Q9_RASE3|nr:hypothetical protein T310_1260 [Rasamsonia emersonii CBS 393.64]KKA24711.1 hypothetical protein T310_1260 [Rasamsonia emersonii CBS 393.64]